MQYLNPEDYSLATSTEPKNSSLKLLRVLQI